MEPQHLIGQPMYADDHCGRYVGLLEQPAPLRDSLTVTGEDDCFGRLRWNVHRDLPSTVVLEHLGDKLSRDCASGLGGRSVLRAVPQKIKRGETALVREKAETPAPKACRVPATGKPFLWTPARRRAPARTRCRQTRFRTPTARSLRRCGAPPEPLRP